MVRPKQRVILYTRGLPKKHKRDMPSQVRAREEIRAAREANGTQYRDCAGCGRRVALKTDGSFRTHPYKQSEPMLKCNGE